MRILEVLLWTLAAFVAGYILLLVMLYFLQSKMMYYPAREIGATPRNIGLEFEDVYFRLDSGDKMHGWHIPENTSEYTLLFFHGNAGNMSGRLDTIRLFHGLGLNVFIVDYPGYGNSEGSPTEESTYKCGQEAYHYLVKQRRTPPEKIIVMGRSLGGPVAAQLAATNRTGGLILESTFTSASDLAVELYPVFPVKQIMRYSYPTTKYLQQVSVPVMVTHSIDDEVVPFHHGEEIFKAAGEPKTFFRMRGRHGAGHLESGAAYKEAIEQFLSANIKIPATQERAAGEK